MAAGSLGLSLASAQPERRPPNIVLIMADDLGYECLGSNGALSYRTPHLDGLARSGVRFTSAHSTPLCTPSRVQIVTGQYNFRNYTEFGSLRRGEWTFAHHLRQAGYRTGVVGKWQLAGAVEGAKYKGVGSLPDEAGFDEHCLWQVKARGSRYWHPTVQVNGELQPPRKGEYGPDIFAGYAERFIERHRSRPFLLYYPMNLTHDPFLPTPHSRPHPPAAKQKSSATWFADTVAYMDTLVGRILAAVERNGLARNTLVLFTGDNGTHPSITTETRGGPFRGGKGGTTTAGTHVPLLARWEGISPRGRVCDDLIDFTDFFPTLAGAAGLEMPDRHPGDGRSFLPQIRGEGGRPRDDIFCHYEPKWGNFQPARWVRDHRWKLYDDGRFFDLSRDPLETGPPIEPAGEGRAAAERFRQVLRRMRA